MARSKHKWTIQENHDFFTDEELVKFAESYKNLPAGLVPPVAVLESIVYRFAKLVNVSYGTGKN